MTRLMHREQAAAARDMSAADANGRRQEEERAVEGVKEEELKEVSRV